MTVNAERGAGDDGRWRAGDREMIERRRRDGDGSARTDDGAGRRRDRLTSGPGQCRRKRTHSAAQRGWRRQTGLRVRVAAAERDGSGKTGRGVAERVERRHRERKGGAGGGWRGRRTRDTEVIGRCRSHGDRAARSRNGAARNANGLRADLIQGGLEAAAAVGERCATGKAAQRIGVSRCKAHAAAEGSNGIAV